MQTTACHFAPESADVLLYPGGAVDTARLTVRGLDLGQRLYVLPRGSRSALS